NEEYLQRNRRLIVVQGFFFPSMSFLLGLSALMVVWLGSREVIGGRITLGQYVAFNSYLTMLSWPMIAFGWVTNMLQRGMASWKRMLEVLDAPPAIADGAPAIRRDVVVRPGFSPAGDVVVGQGFSPAGDRTAKAVRHEYIRGDIEFRDLVF